MSDLQSSSQAFETHKECGVHRINLRDYDWNTYKDIPIIAIVDSFMEILTKLPDEEYCITTATTIACNGSSSVVYTKMPPSLQDKSYSSFCGIIYTTLLQSALITDYINKGIEYSELVKLHFMLGYRCTTREGIMISLENLKCDLQR